MKVTYIKHSGFMVETDKSYLLFDYWEGKIPDMVYGKTLYVFSSHGHHDHYSPSIYKLENCCRQVHYILSSDIRQVDRSWNKMDHVYFMNPYEKMEVGECQIETLKSTDEGVAFLVRIEGKVIYHAGDLHWWDWPGEDSGWLSQQEQTFRAEIEKTAGVPVDIAFTVLDDRLGENFDKGMSLLLDIMRPRYALPMHFWSDRGVISRFRSLHDPGETVILDTANENHWELS